MAQITAANETPLESLPDAPDEEWFRNMLDRSNVFDRQVGAAFMRGITVGENTTSLVKSLDLVHGQSVTVANPLNVPIQGIFAIGCVGLSVGTDGKPNGGIYDLAIPDLQAKPSTRGDGSWVVQANYDIMPAETTGYAGELQERNVLAANAVPLTTATAANITSITLGPGSYRISGSVGYTGTATTVTDARVTANTVSSSSNGVQGDTASRLSVTFLTNSLSVVVPTSFVTVAPGATQTVWLNAQIAFSGGGNTMSAYGRLSIERTIPYLTGRTGRVKLFFFGG